MDGSKLKKIIKSQMAMYGYDANYMAVHMHCDKSTWYKKLQRPERLRFDDLCRIDKILNLKLFNY